MKTVLTLCVLLLLTHGMASYADTPYTFKFGFNNERPDEPDYMLDMYGGVIAYLDKKLAAQGMHADLVITKNLEEMQQKVQQGEINVVSESLFTSLKLVKSGNMQPLLLAWRKGIRAYQSLFVVRQDSPLKSLADLRGKAILFESPRSTSAYAVPKAFLQQQGLTVLPSTQADAPAEAIKYSFSGDEITQAYQVVLRRTEAAAFGTSDWEETPEAVRAQLRILERTPFVLRWLISTHPQMPAEFRTALQQALLEMSSAAEAQALLKHSQLVRFETLSAADQESLEQTKALLAFIE